MNISAPKARSCVFSGRIKKAKEPIGHHGKIAVNVPTLAFVLGMAKAVRSTAWNMKYCSKNWQQFTKVLRLRQPTVYVNKLSN